jgi:hypothetical protein
MASYVPRGEQEAWISRTAGYGGVPVLGQLARAVQVLEGVGACERTPGCLAHIGAQPAAPCVSCTPVVGVSELACGLGRLLCLYLCPQVCLELALCIPVAHVSSCTFGLCGPSAQGDQHLHLTTPASASGHPGPCRGEDVRGPLTPGPEF